MTAEDLKGGNTVAEDKEHYDGVDEKSNGMEDPARSSVEVTVIPNSLNHPKQSEFPKKE